MKMTTTTHEKLARKINKMSLLTKEGRDFLFTLQESLETEDGAEIMLDIIRHKLLKSGNSTFYNF